MKKGFTLIEIIGVIAILAILATAVSPNIIQHLRNAKFDAEEQSLKNISVILKEYTQQNHLIPSETSWSTDLSATADIPANTLLAPLEGGRRLVFHPNLTVLAPLPYNQQTRFQAGGNSNAGTVQNIPMTEGRAMLLSGVEEAAPTTTINATTFDNIWNGIGPINFNETDSVRIERLNFSQLFYNTTITITSGTPSWSLDASTVVNTFSAVPPNSFTVQFLKGTRINLFNDNAGATTAGSIIVNSPLALNFDGTNWNW